MNLLRLQRPDSTSWSPFDQLINLREEINRLFDSPFGDVGRQTEFFHGWTPAVDLYEDKDNLFVRAELPGLKKEEIELSMHNGTLSISGERKLEEKESQRETLRSERFLGRFHRTVTLPKPVRVDQIKASYKDGILTVTLPKTEEAKPKQIEVNIN
jgi:HSP20 family protein